MDPITTAAAVNTATKIGSTLVNAWDTNRQNKRSEAFTQKMYNQQKNDNLDFWNKQNAYNTPARERERLEEAGLNPALVYGQSGGGGTSAGSIKTPDVLPSQFRSANFDGVAGGINDFMDLRIKNAQYNNLQTNNTKVYNDMLMALDRHYNGYGPDQVKGVGRATDSSMRYDYRHLKETQADSMRQDIQIKKKNLKMIDARINETLQRGRGLQMENDFMKALRGAGHVGSLLKSFKYLKK